MDETVLEFSPEWPNYLKRLAKLDPYATRRAQRREAWAAHKAARRKRRKAETLLGKLTGLPRSWRPYVTGWVAMHPAIETKAKRSPVRKRLLGMPDLPVHASTRIPIRERVPRGRLSNPTALR